MATGSVALIYTNARMGYMTTTGTTWDNLKLSLAGAIGNELIFAHELLGNIFLPTNCTNWHEGYALREMATGSVARICTNAMRGHVLWRTAFQAESMQSLPPEDFVPGYYRYALYCLPGRSLCSVVPARHIVLSFYCPMIREIRVIRC